MARSRPARALIALSSIAALVLLAAGCGGPPSTTGSGVDTIEIVTHPVAEGETLASIADDYYGTPDASVYLAEVNGTSPEAALDTGALVDVPVGEIDVARYARRNEAKSHYNRGTGYAGEGRLAEAVEAFRDALGGDPTFVDAGYNLGVVLLMMGEPEAAVGVLRNVVASRPDDASAEFAMGKALFDAGDAASAVTHFERALRLDRSLEEADFARAVALFEAGRIEDAVVALDGYLRRYPDGAWSEAARTRLIELAGEAAIERRPEDSAATGAVPDHGNGDPVPDGGAP